MNDEKRITQQNPVGWRDFHFNFHVHICSYSTLYFNYHKESCVYSSSLNRWITKHTAIKDNTEIIPKTKTSINIATILLAFYIHTQLPFI